jgi:hypothetical protein
MIGMSTVMLHLATRSGRWPKWTHPTYPLSEEHLAQRERIGRFVCGINGTIFLVLSTVILLQTLFGI